MTGEMKGFLAEKAPFTANAQKPRGIPPYAPAVTAERVVMAAL